jgi:hypothetical protein
MMPHKPLSGEVAPFRTLVGSTLAPTELSRLFTGARRLVTKLVGAGAVELLELGEADGQREPMLAPFARLGIPRSPRFTVTVPRLPSPLAVGVPPVTDAEAVPQPMSASRIPRFRGRMHAGAGLSVPGLAVGVVAVTLARAVESSSVPLGSAVVASVGQSPLGALESEAQRPVPEASA